MGAGYGVSMYGIYGVGFQNFKKNEIYFSFFEKYYSPILDILIAHLTDWLDQPINSYGLIKVKREYTEYIDLVICFSQERISYFSKCMLLPFKIFEDCYEAFHFTYFDKWWNIALLIASLYI